MENSSNTNLGIQTEPVQEKPQQEGKKKRNPFLILSAILLVLIFTGLIGYITFISNKTTGKNELPETTIVTTTPIPDTSDTSCFYEGETHSIGDIFKDESTYLTCYCGDSGISCSLDQAGFTRTLVSYETKNGLSKYYMEEYDLSITLPEECSLEGTYEILRYDKIPVEYYLKTFYENAEYYQYPSYTIKNCNYDLSIGAYLPAIGWCEGVSDNTSCHKEEYNFDINNNPVQCSGDVLVTENSPFKSTTKFELFYCPKEFYTAEGDNQFVPAGIKSNWKGIAIFSASGLSNGLSDQDIKSEGFKNIIESIE